MLVTCFRSRRLYNSFLVLVIAQILLLLTYVRISYAPLNYASVLEDATNSPAYNPLFFNQYTLKPDKKVRDPSSSIKTKMILFWTVDNENGREYFVGLGRNAFKKAGCPVWQCENHDHIMLTSGNNNGLLVQDYDAVVFFEPAWIFMDYTPPGNRSSHQHYVFWTLEAPGYLRNLEQWNRFKGFFNRTMTYRLDSDIILPYGWFLPVDPTIVPMYPSKAQLQQLVSQTKVTDLIRAKTKMAVWAVSNCGATNGRNELVERLSKFIEIDIYGNIIRR